MYYNKEANKKNEEMDISEHVKHLKAGDYFNFDEFYKQTSRQVYFTALGLLKSPSLADEILQETYLSFLQTIDRCNQEENIFAYLTVIARNKSLNYWKNANRVVVTKTR